MGLSKKNYVAIANLIKNNLDNDGKSLKSFNTLLSDLCDYFQEDNNLFDRTRFFNYLSLSQ